MIAVQASVGDVEGQMMACLHSWEDVVWQLTTLLKGVERTLQEMRLQGVMSLVRAYGGYVPYRVTPPLCQDVSRFHLIE